MIGFGWVVVELLQFEVVLAKVSDSLVEYVNSRVTYYAM